MFSKWCSSYFTHKVNHSIYGRNMPNLEIGCVYRFKFYSTNLWDLKNQETFTPKKREFYIILGHYDLDDGYSSNAFLLLVGYKVVAIYKTQLESNTEF